MFHQQQQRHLEFAYSASADGAQQEDWTAPEVLAGPDQSLIDGLWQTHGHPALGLCPRHPALCDQF